MRPRTGIAAFVTVVGVAGALTAAGSGAQASTGGIVLGAGAQIITPSGLPEAAQRPGPPGAAVLALLPPGTDRGRVGAAAAYRSVHDPFAAGRRGRIQLPPSQTFSRW
jgi:hypothetical protein